MQHPRLHEHATAADLPADVAAGAAVYTPWVLAAYDRFVHGFSNRFAWGCPTSALRSLYDRNASALHLDVGVGTGYFLDRCRFPTPRPRIVLVDLNPNALGFAARRIARYQPVIHQANVLTPLDAPGGPFRSIALMYVLHCLPGPFARKQSALQHLGEHLADDGVLFGATILGQGVHTRPLGRALQRIYNARGLFDNAGDTLPALEEALARWFTESRAWVQGSVACFEARGYRAR